MGNSNYTQTKTGAKALTAWKRKRKGVKQVDVFPA